MLPPSKHHSCDQFPGRTYTDKQVQVQEATLWQKDGLIQLNFQSLSAFDRVTNQYGRWGVQFLGAIAIQPSNPAFVPHSGSLALMPLTNQTKLTAAFAQAIQKVSAFVIGTKRVVLTAFDENGNILGQVNSNTAQAVEPEKAPQARLPVQRLALEGWNIAKVIFHSDAPFILNDFCFSKTCR
jgi:hypothetical protein